MHYVAYLNPAVYTSIAVHIQHTAYRSHAKKCSLLCVQVALLTSLNTAARDGPDARVIEDTDTPLARTTRPRLDSVELLDQTAVSDESAHVHEQSSTAQTAQPERQKSWSSLLRMPSHS